MSRVQKCEVNIHRHAKIGIDLCVEYGTLVFYVLYSLAVSFTSSINSFELLVSFSQSSRRRRRRRRRHRPGCVLML
jgi:hypothetical protein